MATINEFRHDSYAPCHLWKISMFWFDTSYSDIWNPSSNRKTSVYNVIYNFRNTDTKQKITLGNNGKSLDDYIFWGNASQNASSFSLSEYLNNKSALQMNTERKCQDIIDDKSSFQSFFPIDIGKSLLNEAVAYYKNLFGILPNEYFGVSYSDLRNSKKIDILKTIETIDSSNTLDILYKFAYRAPYEEKSSKFAVNSSTTTTKIKEINYALKSKVLIYISEIFNSLICLYNKQEDLDNVLSHMVFEKEKKNKKKEILFDIVTHGPTGFITKTLSLKPFKVNVDSNYNDDIPDAKIMNFIRSKNESGICILHGIPGTGKTYYIRDLIRRSKQDFIYMDKSCLTAINDSSFISFLTEHKNSIIIMEDCENVLSDRIEYNNVISTLLNLSDGLLADAFNYKFICTFNTDISNIDSALLRKGRLKINYEFKELSIEKANDLAKKIGKEIIFDKPIPLCEILNNEENGAENVKKKHIKIGF